MPLYPTPGVPGVGRRLAHAPLAQVGRRSWLAQPGVSRVVGTPGIDANTSVDHALAGLGYCTRIWTSAALPISYPSRGRAGAAAGAGALNLTTRRRRHTSFALHGAAFSAAARAPRADGVLVLGTGAHHAQPAPRVRPASADRRRTGIPVARADTADRAETPESRCVSRFAGAGAARDARKPWFRHSAAARPRNTADNWVRTTTDDAPAVHIGAPRRGDGTQHRPGAGARDAAPLRAIRTVTLGCLGMDCYAFGERSSAVGGGSMSAPDLLAEPASHIASRTAATWRRDAADIVDRRDAAQVSRCRRRRHRRGARARASRGARRARCGALPGKRLPRRWSRSERASSST